MKEIKRHFSLKHKIFVLSVYLCLLTICTGNISVMSFQTDFLICGIGPLGDQLVVLGYWKDAEKPQRPRMHVLEPRPGDYTDACTDNLSLRGYSEYSSNDYHLGNSFIR